MKLHAVFVEYDRKVRDGNPLAGARIYVFVMDQSSNTTMAKGYRVVIFRLRMEKTRWVSIFITDPLALCTAEDILTGKVRVYGQYCRVCIAFVSSHALDAARLGAVCTSLTHAHTAVIANCGLHDHAWKRPARARTSRDEPGALPMIARRDLGGRMGLTARHESEKDGYWDVAVLPPALSGRPCTATPALGSTDEAHH